MKGLLLSCDAVGESVIWEEGDFISRSGKLPITLSAELRDSLLNWNKRMGALVRTPERFEPTELLETKERLNKEGRQLAAQVEAEHSGQIKVRFLSEP